ncbi:MAG TPA: endolytic transglycosylase MltG [Candidatus Saccharimonadales bacterium]|nr:endolytic transglycosylase MltG [Candidatus Saccharimonadales bacterium]
MRYTAQPEKRSLPKRLFVGLAVLAVLIVGATAVVRHVYFQNLKPVTTENQAADLVTIKKGSTVDEIAAQLEQAGIIRSAWAFKLYVGSKNVRDSLQAGTYSLSASQSVAQIVAQLTHGKVATNLVTIIPGQKISQIRTTLLNYGFGKADVDEALNPAAYAGNPALVDKPAGAGLDGYVYPESYQKDSSTTAKQIISEALAQMNTQLTPDLREAFAKQGISTYEAITLASVIEREVPDHTDRKQAAQVFLKRLRTAMPLQSDATKPEFDSYANLGLPPVPISNVTAGSLDAVAHPADTDWLYFVSGDDGITRFSKTIEEHEANVKQYCHKLCGQ